MKARKILCPSCGSEIQLDTSTYDNLASQIRKQVVDEATERKEAEMTEKMKSAVMYERSQAQLQIRDAMSQKDKEINEMKSTLERYKRQANDAFMKQKASNDAVIAQNKSQISALQKEIDMQKQSNESAVARAVAEEKDKSRQKDAEIANLHQQIAVMREQESGKIGRAIAAEKEKGQKRDAQISLLSVQLDAEKRQTEMRVKEAVADHEKLEAELRERISSIEKAKTESETSLKEKYETLIQVQKDELDKIKEFKSKLSVKMVGEDLETFIYDEYRSIASLFPETASFKKDNTVKDGMKGDFEYKETTDDGTLVLSVMFELKNESPDSVNKHKPEDFFDHLDKERKSKGDQIAVLCSTLSPDSEYYNRGIVTVPEYEDMYCIRPNCFVALLLILRSAAIQTIKYKRELEDMRRTNIDVTNFEAAIDDFKESFGKSLDMSMKKKESALELIDRAISSLQKAKDQIEGITKNLTVASNKVDKALTVKKLTKNAPSVAELISASSETTESAVISADREDVTRKDTDIKKAV